MLEGDPVPDGFGSAAVYDALDLCLSCKACKTECPVSVDMATYRAEFLHHYYRSHARPLSSFGMGLVHVWAPITANLPWLMNAITQTPGLSTIARITAGVHPKRSLPRLAHRPFRQDWSGSRQHRPVRALLWVDTFNNHFTPEPLHAAAQVLERSGHEVVLSPHGLCCGRPFYDFGRLDAAKRYLLHCLDGLTPLLDARTWLVGIEPSCLSVFRDELLSLFPHDERAKRLAERALTLGQFLHLHGHAPIRLGRDVAIHGHCHSKSLLGTEADLAVLKMSGRKAAVLDDGCCGMAGAFGYEKAKYDISEAIARQGVVPHIEKTPDNTILVADGFSCRHQIAHFTDRETLTLPELLRQAMQ
jgi:Fe-S oxidoreductase